VRIRQAHIDDGAVAAAIVLKHDLDRCDAFRNVEGELAISLVIGPGQHALKPELDRLVL
jgi:hypothetical protein